MAVSPSHRWGKEALDGEWAFWVWSHPPARYTAWAGGGEGGRVQGRELTSEDSRPLRAMVEEESGKDGRMGVSDRTYPFVGRAEILVGA